MFRERARSRCMVESTQTHLVFIFERAHSRYMGAHRRYINHHMLVAILAQIRMHVDLVLFEEVAKAAIPVISAF